MIVIRCNIDDSLADPAHETGVTDEGYGLILERLVSAGCYDIDISKDDES